MYEKETDVMVLVVVLLARPCRPHSLSVFCVVCLSFHLQSEKQDGRTRNYV
jgi:hypothetical protein